MHRSHEPSEPQLTEEVPARRSDDPAFRRLRAKHAALILHHTHPELAREAGRKGGLATADAYPGGRRAWAVGMAMRRWHPKTS
jgi:hypothetical protein